MSYIVQVRALSGLLLGGTTRHTSSRFESKADAEAWRWQAVRVNIEAGRFPDEGRIIESERFAEVKHSNA